MHDVDLQHAAVFKNLGDPFYRVRRFGLRLTDDDIVALAILTFLVFTLVNWSGVGQQWFLTPALTLDPFAPIGCLLAAAYGLTVAHTLRPEGNPSEVVRAGGSPKLFSPASFPGDFTWRPGVGRIADLREQGAL